jgi:hypothetical protein
MQELLIQQHQDLDLSGNAYQSFEQQVQIVEQFQNSSIRSLLPQKSVAIDPPFGKRGLSISERVLRFTQNTEMVRAPYRGENPKIAQHIIETTNEVSTDVGLVLMNYFLHDVPPEHHHQFLNAVRQKFPNAAIGVNDYALFDVPHNEVAKYLVTSDAEHSAVKEKGLDKFLYEHRCFTLSALRELFAVHFNHVNAKALKAGRGLVIGYDHNDSKDNSNSASVGSGVYKQELMPAA